MEVVEGRTKGDSGGGWGGDPRLRRQLLPNLFALPHRTASAPRARGGARPLISFSNDALLKLYKTSEFPVSFSP